MNDRRKLTASERQQIYKKFGGHCAYCGCEITIKDMQADHVVPLHLGGADDISNLYPACRACNHYKSTFDVEKFRAVIEQAPNVLMRDSATYRNIARFGLINNPEDPVVRFWFEKHWDMEREKAIKLKPKDTHASPCMPYRISESEIVGGFDSIIHIFWEDPDEYGEIAGKRFTCTEDGITLGKCFRLALGCGYAYGNLMVIEESPLNGAIYRYGNHGESWEKIGEICGYA
jgi:hypothetical protein